MPGTDGGRPDDGADSATPVTCPSPALPPGDSMQTVQVGGVSRSYFLHVPSTYDGSKPVPLVVDFHAFTASGTPAMQQRNLSTYPDVADPEGVVMAFPSGLTGPSGAAWNVGPCCVANVDDVAFTRALVAQVSTTACIDPKRVYATGFSMGGGMAHYLACHAADVFAAVAPSAFDLLQENVGDCLPPRPDHGDLVPRQRGQRGAVRRRILCRGSRHAGHVPRRAGDVPEVGRRSTNAPARRRRRTATDARPTRAARAASRSFCARTRAAARRRATPPSPGRCSNGIRFRKGSRALRKRADGREGPGVERLLDHFSGCPRLPTKSAL